jgi:hypothetical protein
MNQGHLRNSEFVDLIDGTLDDARGRHVRECVECREKADALTAAVTGIAEADVPEPSPVFWDHFSARVRRAIEAEPRPASGIRRLFMLPRAASAALATAAVMMLAAGIWRATSPVQPADAPVANTVAVTANPVGDASADDTLGDIESDEAWALVRTFADDLDAEDMDDAGVGAHPGSAERATHGLSERERIELAQLLQAAIKAGGTAESSS